MLGGLNQKLFTAISFIKHLLHAGNAHGLHSPFIYEFYTKVVRAKNSTSLFTAIEAQRLALLQDEQIVHLTDFGAGSRASTSVQRKVSTIAKHSVSQAKVSQLLYRTIQYYQSDTVLELGTSLGVNTSYLALAVPQSHVFTLEGCPQLAELAKKNLERLSIKARVFVGDINETLPKVISEMPSLDFVFFDANHRYQPTIDYFEMCKAKAHEESIFVFDDIYWSAGMAKAWQEITADPAVGFSVDLFHVGVVFFRKKQPKQHFRLKL